MGAYIEEYYSADLWLEHAANNVDATPIGHIFARSPLESLDITFLTIGTPNEINLKGSVTQITAIVALLAAVIALPKIPLEREQLRVTIAKTEAETRVVEVQALSAELELIERAKRLQLEGKITESELVQQLERLKRIRPVLSYAAGVVREIPTVESPSKVATSRLQVKVLERARALGAVDPTINLFLAVFSGDTTLILPALDAGADPNLPFEKLVKQLPAPVTNDDTFKALLNELIKSKRN